MKLSVIMPVYNVEDYLQNMISSILAQNFENFEMILVDDGSTDGSGEICDSFAQMDKRVKVFHIKNGGVSNARNFGLSKANGEYVHFADADDFVENGMYADFNKIVERYSPDIVMCSCRQINVKNNTCTVVGRQQNSALLDKCRIRAYLDGIDLFDMRCLIHYIWNKWYKREVLVNSKMKFLTDLSLGEDYVFNCQLLRNVESMYILGMPYYEYYIRGNSLVSAFQPEPWKSRQMLLDAHTALYQEYGIWDTNKNSILLEEGKMCFVALRSVNSIRCTLNPQEKKCFIEKMYTSDQMQFVLYYLKNSKKRLHKIWLSLINTMGISGVKIVLFFDRLQRIWEARR